jgi:hypothetical protein
LLTRIFLILFGGVALAWGWVTVPIFWRQATIEHVARHIIRGEPYADDVLMRQMPVVEAVETSSDCRPIALWSAAIIQLRFVERISHTEVGKAIDKQKLNKLDTAIKRSLSCSPAEPFMWLVLYWAEREYSGLNSNDSKYLELSYRLGPDEGWIALKRNPLAFSNYAILPAGLKAYANNEFLGLINSRFYQQAASILGGPAWFLRDELLQKLTALPLRKREEFAKAVYDRGLVVTIPGIKSPDSRPWRHKN